MAYLGEHQTYNARVWVLPSTFWSVVNKIKLANLTKLINLGKTPIRFSMLFCS